MSSKWTEKLFNLFKINQSQKADPLMDKAMVGEEKNPRTLLARRIMKVMKDPHPTAQEEEVKKPKP